MLYDIVSKDILKNKDIKTSGGFTGIPMPFERLKDYIPLSAERGQSVGVLAATGAGKSRFTRWMWIYHAYKFHKETGYPLKIIYLPLEDSKEKVMRNMICHYLHELYGTFINLQELDSKGQRTLPDFVQQQLVEAEEFFTEFESVVTVIDGLNEPTEIFEYLQDYAKKTGETVKYKVGEKWQFRYIPHNNVHTIVIVDNMSNIDREEGLGSERESIVHFCKTLVRGRLCNFFNFTVVQVLQQDFASERQSYTRDGDSIIEKLEPSLAAIGDSKTIARSMHIIYGMFHPSRFGIASYPKPTKYNKEYYRIDLLGNRFRSLSVLKANDVDFGMKIPFNFDAVTENMKELPPLGSQELQGIYSKIQQKQVGNYSKSEPVQQEYKPFDEEDDECCPF